MISSSSRRGRGARARANADSGVVCPVLPWPIQSVFHTDFITELPEVTRSALSMYHLFEGLPKLRAFLFFSSLLSTVAEWILALYLVWWVLWRVLIGPIVGLVKLILVAVVAYKLLQVGIHSKLGERMVPANILEQVDELFHWVDFSITHLWGVVRQNVELIAPQMGFVYRFG
mmetsp:Transcript_35112/g.87189  ORF Transcript_35112/g.87189 Transcript_35112/m.87189 type:complete len:173 (-) Transcript_35112:381-899(-)